MNRTSTMRRQYLAEVYNDTKELSVTQYAYSKPNVASKETTRNLRNVPLPQAVYQPRIDVVNNDTLVVCNDLLEKGYLDVLALNLCSDYVPGGGVEHGSMAQEEELFRRSNYYLSLDRKFYPMKSDEVLYSDSVLVFKDTEYKELEKPFKVSFVAAFAIRHPEVTLKNGENVMNERDINITRERIENIFLTAIKYKHTSIVLGAIGCGVFGNPPNEIAKIYNECIMKYGKYFRIIVFAIKSVRDENFDVFNKLIVRRI